VEEIANINIPNDTKEKINFKLESELKNLKQKIIPEGGFGLILIKDTSSYLNLTANLLPKMDSLWRFSSQGLFQLKLGISQYDSAEKLDPKTRLENLRTSEINKQQSDLDFYNKENIAKIFKSLENFGADSKNYYEQILKKLKEEEIYRKKLTNFYTSLFSDLNQCKTIFNQLCSQAETFSQKFNSFMSKETEDISESEQELLDLIFLLQKIVSFTHLKFGAIKTETIVKFNKLSDLIKQNIELESEDNVVLRTEYKEVARQAKVEIADVMLKTLAYLNFESEA
jgi:hypothetical protein